MLVVVVVSAYVVTHRASADDADLLDLGPGEQAAALDTAPDAQAIHAHIREVAARYGVSSRLVVAVIAVESEFNPRAVSRKGARGLMQLMPATALSLSVHDSFDPLRNIDAGVRHLRRLMDRFDRDLPLVLAAYNAGERAVIVHRGIPPYRETRKYVVRVLRRVDPDLARAFIQEYGRRRASPARGRDRVSLATAADHPAASVRPIRLDGQVFTDGGFVVRLPPGAPQDERRSAAERPPGRAVPQGP